MKTRFFAVVPALALAAALAACASASGPGGDPVATACAQVAAVQSSPEGKTLDQLDPHGATGILWADAKAACAATKSVNGAWLLGVLELLVKAAPLVAPIIAGAL